MKPKLLHSLWTRPLEVDVCSVDRMTHLIGDVWIYALSLAYAQREGFEVELHTDSLGKAFLGNLPYNGVYTTLDAIPRKIHPRFWAAGKAFALESGGCGSVHIDGDVFIKNSNLLTLPEGEWDVVAQSIEHFQNFIWEESRMPRGYKAACTAHGINSEMITDYNAGVIGFNDEWLLREYTSRYRLMAEDLSSKFWNAYERDRSLVPDLITEQLLFYQLCQKCGARVHLVLGEPAANPSDVGYQHLMTSHKYLYVPKVKATLKRFFPEYYNIVYRLCQKL